jgi:hypothetical protein
MMLCFNQLTTFIERARENEQDEEHSAEEASPYALKHPKIPSNARHPAASALDFHIDPAILAIEAHASTLPACHAPRCWHLILPPVYLQCKTTLSEEAGPDRCAQNDPRHIETSGGDSDKDHKDHGRRTDTS